MQKKAIQLGAGNIGRGFIGALLQQAGYHVVFADVNEEIINKINQDKKYTVHVMDEQLRTEEITNISAVISTKPEMIEEIAQAQMLTTAVGLVILPRVANPIAQGIKLRKEQNNTEYLNIIACENAVNASSTLKDAVYAVLDDDTKVFADSYIGFPNCSVDRIVPPVKSENIIDVVVENYYEWNVEKAGFKGPIPQITGMNLAENLMAYIERKLFTLNTGHAICSYIGYLKGLKTVDQSICDDEIYTIVKEAMIESGEGLIKKYNLDKESHLQYIDKIIKRFKNKYLEDDTTRVGREPLRKLSPTDRLVNPMMTAYNYGFGVTNLVIGIGAALHYNNAEDPQSIELQSKITQLGVRKAFTEISQVSDPALLDMVEKAYVSFEE